MSESKFCSGDYVVQAQTAKHMCTHNIERNLNKPRSVIVTEDNDILVLERTYER